MKFLCVSDQIDPLIYSSTVKERYGDVDAVFCAGDLSMEYVDFIVDALGKPTFFVFGNHDLKEYKYYKNKPKDSIFMDLFFDKNYKMIALFKKKKEINFSNLRDSLEYINSYYE